MIEENIKQFTVARGLTFVAEGFDNAVYTDANKMHAFRFPKKLDRIDTLRQEAVVLPILTFETCGAIVPAPTLQTEGDLLYGIYPFVTGLLYADIATNEQADLLAKTAAFLKNLHRLKNPAIRKLPVINSYERFKTIYEGFAQLADILDPAQLAYGENLFTSFLAHQEYKAIEPVLIHGDISLDHVYYQNGQISVIDWSDFQLADPAYDFHHLLNELPKSAHTIFLNNYDTGEDQSFWDRAYTYRFMDTFEVLLQAFQAGNTVRVQEFIHEIDRDTIQFFQKN